MLLHLQISLVLVCNLASAYFSVVVYAWLWLLQLLVTIYIVRGLNPHITRLGFLDGRL